MMEKLKKYWYIVLIVVIALVAGLIFAINSNNKKDDDFSDDVDTEEIVDDEEVDMAEFDNGIVYEEEVEGAELSFKEANQEDFYGKWKAESGQSIYMYGNVDLNIKDDGTWTGNIADEDESGTWTFENGSMKLTSEFVELTLSYEENGNLIMQEDREGDGDLINTVLTKK